MASRAKDLGAFIIFSWRPERIASQSSSITFGWISRKSKCDSPSDRGLMVRQFKSARATKRVVAALFAGALAAGLIFADGVKKKVRFARLCDEGLLRATQSGTEPGAVATGSKIQPATLNARKHRMPG